METDSQSKENEYNKVNINDTFTIHNSSVKEQTIRERKCLPVFIILYYIIILHY